MDQPEPPAFARPAVLLVAHRTHADTWTVPLEAAGYTVILHDRPDPHTYRWIRDHHPTAIILDSAAHAALPLLDLLRRSPWANSIPIVRANSAEATRIAAALR